MGIFIGIIMIAAGIALILFCWGILMVRGWTGTWWERRLIIRAQQQKYGKRRYQS